MNNYSGMLAGILSLALAGVLAWVLLGRLRAAKQLKEQQEFIEKRERERQATINASFLAKVKSWKTELSNPFITGLLDGSPRGFLFIPTLPGHVSWLVGMVNSGRFVPRSAVAFNNRNPEQTREVERQLLELIARNCPVAPAGTAPDLYNISLCGPVGDGSTMEGLPHDTTVEMGFQAIPVHVAEGDNGGDGGSRSVIVDMSAFELPAPAEAAEAAAEEMATPTVKAEEPRLTQPWIPPDKRR